MLRACQRLARGDDGCRCARPGDKELPPVELPPFLFIRRGFDSVLRLFLVRCD